MLFKISYGAVLKILLVRRHVNLAIEKIIVQNNFKLNYSIACFSRMIALSSIKCDEKNCYDRENTSYPCLFFSFS